MGLPVNTHVFFENGLASILLRPGSGPAQAPGLARPGLGPGPARPGPGPSPAQNKKTKRDGFAL